MAIDRNLVQGSMAMMILRLLETKDMYGYETVSYTHLLYCLVGCTAGFEKYPESEAQMFPTADASQ